MNFPTFLIMNLDDKLDIKKLASYISQNYFSYQIIVASKKSHGDIFNVSEFVFEEDDQDKIINTLMQKVEGNKLVLARKIDNDNLEELVNLEKNIKHENQIATLKKEKNKVSKFFFNLLNKIIELIFGYTLYDCNLCCMAFASVPLEVLKVLDNCSLYTKINKWKGLNFVSNKTTLKTKIKFKTKIAKNVLFLISSIIIIAGCVLVWVFVEYIQKQLLLKLFLVFVMVICLFVVFLEILRIFIKQKIGENIFDKAEILNKN